MRSDLARRLRKRKDGLRVTGQKMEGTKEVNEVW